jgi:hypothetical protein
MEEDEVVEQNGRCYPVKTAKALFAIVEAETQALMKAGGASSAGSQKSRGTGSFGISLAPLINRARRPLGGCHAVPRPTQDDT